MYQTNMAVLGTPCRGGPGCSMLQAYQTEAFKAPYIAVVVVWEVYEYLEEMSWVNAVSDN